jgi:hypothetical protein
MKKRRALSAMVALAAIFSLAAPVLPQADVSTATLKGMITDPNGAVVAGASVTAKNLATGITRTAKSNEEGGYQIPLLQPGQYELKVEAAGFETKVASPIELTVGQILVYNVEMRIGGVATEVVVTADTPIIEVERTQQANTIDVRQIENLPNIGRAFTTYVYTLPGVSDSNAPRVQFPGFTFGTSGFSIGGSNGRNNLITFDGGENEYGSGQLRTNISIEAIQEFQVNRNAFAAEFGFTAGTAVNVVTKGGTNEFHGSAYTFYRSQKTSARNFFDRGAKKAFDQQVYPGFTLGGPIAKNKAFFFTSYEMLKSDAARFRRYTDNPILLGPTAAQSAYIAQLEASTNATIRRIGVGLRAALTTTNFPTTMKMLRDNEGAFTSPGRFHSWTTRVDYHIGERDSIMGRFSLTHNNDDQLGLANDQSPSSSTDLFYRDYTAVISWMHNFSTTLTNQFRTQLVLNNSAKTVPELPDSTSLLIAGVGNFGRPFLTPFNTFQDRYQFEDIVAWGRGRHNFKFGASYRPVNYRVINELWFSGEWTFSSGIFPIILAVAPADRPALVVFNRANRIPDNGPPAANLTSIQSFNLGLPFLFRQGFNNPEWKDWAHYLGAFAQDSWKVSPRFTLDIGIRVDYDAEPKPLNKNTYLSPRLGFAWDPFGNQKTVIRGGGGLFYSPIYYQVTYVTNLLDDSGRFINQIFKTPADGAQSPAALWAFGVGLNKLPFKALSEADIRAFGITIGRGAPGRVIFEADPNYKNNYSAQASLGISREIMRDLSLEVAYQMYRGVHIQVPHERNYRESGVVNPAFGPQFVRIDPTITQRNVYASIGNSIYHGMTASLTKRYRNNYQLQINYTFSKAIDDNTDFNSAFAAFIPTRLDLERAISVFDIRHNFVASGVFRTPFKAGSGQNLIARALADITISPVIFLRSGIPFTLRIGRDVNGDTHGLYDRPFLASRNTGRGENFYNVNLRINKQFYINRDSGLRVEFIAEATNLLNRTNFLAVNDVVCGGNVDPRFTDPAFPGCDTRILFGPFNLRGSKAIPSTAPLGFTAAASPRQFQFGLKVAF